MSESTSQTVNTSKLASKKVFVETWGCQMNVADSEHMLGLLKANQYQTTFDENEADLFLLNTCHIRDKAKHKVLSRLGRLNLIKQKNPDVKIAVAGCVAQAEGKKLLQAAPYIDVILSPSKISELPSLLAKNTESQLPEISLGHTDHHASSTKQENLNSTNSRKNLPTLSGKNEVSRYVNIMQGCNNFCTFCVVPFTRGPEISRMPDDVLSEVRMLIAGGAKEVTFLGQNVNSYGNDLVQNGKLNHADQESFVELLKAVLNEPGLERLRFTTSNPHDFTYPLANLFAQNQKLGKYIHLPVQSGSNDVLERMRRKVTVDEYMQRINWLKEAHPDMAISTDLIVGFPGETDDDFMQTLDLVEKVRYSFVFCFKYSPRQKTAAARFKDQIDDKTMSLRLAKLNCLQDKITAEQNNSEIGSHRKALILYKSKKEENYFYGRTEHFRLVKIHSKDDILGDLINIKITNANKTSLIGSLI